MKLKKQKSAPCRGGFLFETSEKFWSTFFKRLRSTRQRLGLMRECASDVFSQKNGGVSRQDRVAICRRQIFQPLASVLQTGEALLLQTGEALLLLFGQSQSFPNVGKCSSCGFPKENGGGSRQARVATCRRQVRAPVTPRPKGANISIPLKQIYPIQALFLNIRKKRGNVKVINVHGFFLIRSSIPSKYYMKK